MKKKMIMNAVLVMAFLGLVGSSHVFGRSFTERDEYLREMRMSRESREVRNTHYQDTRIAEFQVGKDITDLHGRRVRIEQYILRPQSNQYEHLVYNHRDGRIDEAKLLRTFNKDLPERLADIAPWDDALSFNSYPEYYATDTEATLSNGIDSFQYKQLEGQIYKEAKNSYQLLYGKELCLVNEIEKMKMIRSDHDPRFNLRGLETWWVPNKEGVLSKFASTNGEIYDISILPDFEERVYSPEWRETVTWRFADNTFLSIDEAWIDDDGELLLRDVWKSLTLVNWKEEISRWNVELSVKATEFEGRDIDVVASPNIFVIALEDTVEASPVPRF